MPAWGLQVVHIVLGVALVLLAVIVLKGEPTYQTALGGLGLLLIGNAIKGPNQITATDVAAVKRAVDSVPPDPK